MMALVAYDYSDESDDEIKDTEVIKNEKQNFLINDGQSNHQINLENEVEVITEIRRPHSFIKEELSDEEEDTIPVSFSNLPQPNYHAFNIDESKIKNSKLNNLSKLIPTRSRNKASEELKKKHMILSRKESGLLAMLPSPTEKLTLTSQLSTNSESLKKLIPDSVKKKEVSKNEKVESSTNSNTNDEDDIGVDFFSLSKVVQLDDSDSTDIDMLETEIMNSVNRFTVKRPNEFSSVTNVKNTETDDTIRQAEDSVFNADYEENGFSNNHDSLSLDEDAIQKLCGRKRKGQVPDDIQLIDIREDKILAESKKLLAKHLTEEVTYRPSQKKFAGPSSLEKRKHQITYLAYQAKERELELKNQWANNRFTKKQTQSKYGF